MDEQMPVFDIGKIKMMESLRQKAYELKHAFDSVSQPLLDDMTLLEPLYLTYRSEFERQGRPEDANRVYYRKQFLLVILYLYSPKALVGGKMRIGLRSRLAEMFGIDSHSPISDNCTDLLFHYTNYRDFKKGTDVLYKRLISTLDISQLNLSE